MAGLLSIERREAVAVLTLQRPDKRNALSIELRIELADALGALGDDDGVGCIVLTGAGPAFCSGMDVTQFGGDRAHREQLVETSVACFRAVARCPRPTVAAVNGPALAGGFALALLCDLRLASEEATFGFPELPRGIPPSYAAARAALPAAIAAEVTLTGRMFDAFAALRLGIVGSVHPPEELLARAIELAGRIASAPRDAIAETKRRIVLDRDREFGPLFAEEERLLRETLLRDDPDDAAVDGAAAPDPPILSRPARAEHGDLEDHPAPGRRRRTAADHPDPPARQPGRLRPPGPGEPGLRGGGRAARAAGFAAVERLAGGRAAVFHHGTIAIARAYSDPQPPKRTYARFEETAEMIAAALRGLGVDARVGEVPGEYCPGAYSVNARGATKLSGIGQRMIRGGAHMGGVVVASAGGRVARVLEARLRRARARLGPRDHRQCRRGSSAARSTRRAGGGLIAELQAAATSSSTPEIDEETMRGGPAQFRGGGSGG